MELQINRVVLERELSLLAGVVAKKDTIPALTGILFEADDNKVVLTGTDLDTTLRTEIDAEVVTPGKVLFRAKQFTEIVKSLDGETVSFAPIPFDERIQVSCGPSSFKVPILGEGFPRLPDAATDPVGTVQSKTLASMIGRVIFTVPGVAILTALPGAALCFEDGAVRLEATDGTRLARVRAEGEGAADAPVTLNVPRRALEALLGLTSGSDPAIITVSQNANQMLFSFGRRLFTATRLAGQLPAYDVIFSKLVNLPNIAALDVKRFVASIRRVSLMTRESEEGINLTFSGLGPELRFNASNGLLGDADESMPISYQGEDMEVRVNATFLTDFLGAVGVETVTAGMINPKAPSLWTARTDTMEYRYVLTPILRNGPAPEPEKPKSKRGKKGDEENA